jgi:hypothetical protein
MTRATAAGLVNGRRTTERSASIGRRVDGTFAAPLNRAKREKHLPPRLSHAGQARDVRTPIAPIVSKGPQAT